MNRQEVIDFLREEIKRTEAKLNELARQKAGADNPRTSWHSQVHLDLERSIADYQRYRDRCSRVLDAVEKNRINDYIHEGSIVSLSIGGEEDDYIIVKEGGAAIGRYAVVSAKSPIGEAIWDKQAGDEAMAKTPQGKIAITIIRVA